MKESIEKKRRAHGKLGGKRSTSGEEVNLKDPSGHRVWLRSFAGKIRGDEEQNSAGRIKTGGPGKWTERFRITYRMPMLCR